MNRFFCVLRTMQGVVAIGLLLMLSLSASGQQTKAEPPVAPGQQQAESPTKRYLQLVRAADELEQAGYKDQAATARHEADKERESLLRRLDALQAEAEQIRTATRAVPQVLIHLQLVEVSLSKAKQLGIDVAKLSGAPSLRPAASWGLNLLTATKRSNS